jgi:hypothetical protein
MGCRYLENLCISGLKYKMWSSCTNSCILCLSIATHCHCHCVVCVIIKFNPTFHYCFITSLWIVFQDSCIFSYRLAHICVWRICTTRFNTFFSYLHFGYVLHICNILFQKFIACLLLGYITDCYIMFQALFLILSFCLFLSLSLF